MTSTQTQQAQAEAVRAFAEFMAVKRTEGADIDAVVAAAGRSFQAAVRFHRVSDQRSEQEFFAAVEAIRG